MLIKTKSQNEGMIFYHIHPSHTENPKMYSCGELVWNDPLGLLDIAHKWKKNTDICATCRLCVISSVSYYILLEMVLFRTCPNWWVWIILIQLLCILDDCIYHRLIWICTNSKGSYILCQHELILLNFKQNAIIASSKPCTSCLVMRLTVKLKRDFFFNLELLLKSLKAQNTMET